MNSFPQQTNGRGTSSWPPAEQPSAGRGGENALEQGLWILRRRKWVFLQAVVVVTAVVAALTLSQEKSYTAHANLLLRDEVQSVLSDINLTAEDPDRRAATNDRLVDLRVVADRAAKSIGGGLSGQGVDAAVATKSDQQSDILDIAASGSSAELATRIADAYGRAYISFRRDTERAQLNSAIRLIERRLRALPPAPTPSAGTSAVTESGDLQQRVERLRLARSLKTGGATLVQPADITDVDSSPRVTRNIILGILLGALIGFLLAALRERADRTVKSVEELERIYHMPVLGRIPRSRALSVSHLMDGRQPGGREEEAFRALRANLRVLAPNGRMGSVLVASPLRGEGKTTVARALAMTMADMGDSVVLVEGDLHTHGAGRPGDLGTAGLSTVLRGAALDEALSETPVSLGGEFEEPRTLVTLPPGPIPPNPSELLESELMRKVVASLEERFEYVIIDSAPLALVSDALALLPVVSGVIIVGAIGVTTRSVARDLRNQLTMVGGRPLGLVANFRGAEPTSPASRQRSLVGTG